MSSTLDRLRRSIDSFSSASVLIVGDVMLDQFVVGHVSRISPEAPVPVVEYDHDDYRVGGAVERREQRPRARWRVELVGPDRRGQRRAAPSAPAASSAASARRASSWIPSRRTTTKLRIVTTRNLQVARIDYESDHEASGEAEQALADQVDRLAPARRAPSSCPTT